MKKEELIKIQVSVFRQMRSASSDTVDIETVLNAIKGSFYESQVKTIRFLKDHGKQQEANEVKQNLHAVTFCATFNSRRLSSLYKNYNSLIVIDIDKLEPDEMIRVKRSLEELPLIACYWISPSGSGWKGLVVIDYQNRTENMDVVDMHHWAFVKLEEVFKEKYSIKLDSSGKDITRLCFMSWCPELRIKEEFDKFVVNLDEMIIEHRNNNDPAKKIVLQSSGEPIMWNHIDGQKQENRKGNSYDRILIERIYKYLATRNLSITSSYEDWVKVAFAIAHTFHSVYGRRIFMKLCKLDGASHNETKSERLIYDAYIAQEKKCDFSTIIYLAKGKGFIR